MWILRFHFNFEIEILERKLDIVLKWLIKAIEWRVSRTLQIVSERKSKKILYEITCNPLESLLRQVK